MLSLLPLLLAASSALADPIAWPQPIGIDLTPETRNQSTSTACADVHVIIARASTEPPGQGLIGTLATKVAANIANTTVEWIPYPALLFPYDFSSWKGTEMTKASIVRYANSCSGKIILLGYSQGANVVGDVMCGGGGAVGLGAWTAPIASNYSDRVAAVIMMGDPRHMTNVSWDVGTAQMDGLFPRPGNVSCDSVASKIKSYCDAGDPYCARGMDLSVHLTYCDRYNQDAYNFIVGKLKEVNTVQQTQNGTLTTNPDSATTTTKASGTSKTSSTSKTSPQSSNDGARQTTVGAPLALVVLLLFSVFA